MSNTKTVLICDDSILARKQLGDVIRKFDSEIEIVQATNGEEAVEKYKEVHPALTFLDIVMPKMDGITAVKNIVEYDEDADIVIVSSVGTQTQLKAAIEAGARDFVQKPFSESQVDKIVRAHLEEA
ncbi:MAG: response regulator [Lachnospiraceae bacterium]|mgnify:CR=1|jgi:two-component system chemotaxis response regulator CheY|nr:response regulator [Lachnospiraceae bacterium]MCI7328617.1 response regulator [Lachnospiraceae bacterium]MDD7701456.1 response regulator [Lachnospiraceae bacterium]MDY3300879.1 response regulator [Lachnospiraceae bacterium]MEE3379534.1 response regulator [Lachnospiraceae bacterium]